MIAAIHQPLYLPWQAYFGKIAAADVFVFLDDVQYPRGKGFFNRNAIKGPEGALMLTAPVKGKGDMPLVGEIGLDQSRDWQARHWRTIEVNYAKAPHFPSLAPGLENLYLGPRWARLAELNVALIRHCCDVMEIKTRFVLASALGVGPAHGAERLVGLVQAVGADRYLTGSGAGSLRHMDEPRYNHAGIDVLWHAYEQRPYPQMWGTFVPDLAVLDLLLNCGPGDSRAMLSSCSRWTHHAP